MTTTAITITGLAVLAFAFFVLFFTELKNRKRADFNFQALEGEMKLKRESISHLKSKLVEERGNSETLAKNLQDEQTEVRQLKTKNRGLSSELKEHEKTLAYLEEKLKTLKEQYGIKDDYTQAEFGEQLIMQSGDVPEMAKEIQGHQEYINQCLEELPEKFRTTRGGNQRALHMAIRLAVKESKPKVKRA